MKSLLTSCPSRWIRVLVLGAFAGAVFGDEPNAFIGTPVAVGNGSAWVMVTTNTRNEPESVSVVMTRDALQGLPAYDANKPAWEFAIPIPEAGPRTGYDHVLLDWNPAGHLPEGVYSVPHFDVHFYLIKNEEREAITFHGEDRVLAMVAPDEQLVPAGYVIPPDAAVDRMGMHGLDPAGVEFHGQPFSHNFIYGYYRGELMFVEPMVSLDFLQSLKDSTTPVSRPQRYSYPAWYPATYRIAFDSAKDEYTIGLQDLQRFD
ncbi:MAG: DUF5602 domain-containing protein [Marinobacter sp.]|nr:DUF5602 domain-containing protein [Marinobacter sp.]